MRLVEWCNISVFHAMPVELNQLPVKKVPPIFVLCAMSRQYIEVAKERYLSQEVRPAIHRLMAAYFTGTWSDGRKKSLSLKIWKGKKRKVDRQVASQVKTIGQSRMLYVFL